jgi:uncharacterized protein YhaN
MARRSGLMGDVVFTKLTLSGFGLYRDPTSFAFDPSLAVLTGSNESGKSTIVNGLMATLFGLRRREDDVEGFTTARFKNWSSPGEFWGELELTASGRIYRLRREFEGHQTLLSIEGDGGREMLFQGEHNRYGRGPEVKLYNDVLGRVLGVADQTLFESVFCVTQEMDEEPRSERGHAVQQLIAGARESSYNDVLEELFEAFRSVTRESGKYEIASPGKQPRDARTDQALELVELEIEELQRKLDSSQMTLAGLAEIRDQLAEAEKNLVETRRAHDSSKRTLDIWGRWNGLARERVGLEKEQTRLGRVIDTCTRLERESKDSRVAVLKDFPEFEKVPPDLKEKLDTLASVTGDTQRAGDERLQIESDIRESFGEDVFSRRTPEDLLQQLDRRAEVEKNLEEKARELQEIEVRSSAARERRRRKAVVLGFVGLVAGLVLGVVLRFDTLEAVLLMLGAGIVAGGISFLVIRPTMEDPADVERYKELTKEVIPAIAKLAELNKGLESLAAVEAEDLGVLREKLRRLTTVSRDAEDVDEEASMLSRELAQFLESAGGDPARTKRRYEDFEKRMQAGRTAESKLQELLKTEQAKSVDDLAGMKTRLDNTVQGVIAQERALRSEHPFLERISSVKESMELSEEHDRLEQDVQRGKRLIDSEDRKIRELERDLARLEGEDLIDVAAEEVRLKALEARRERLLLDRDAILLAYRVTRDAIDTYQEGHQEILGRSVNEKFAVFTGRPGRRVELMPDFSPRIVEESGQKCALGQLSRGAQDQLDLAVRLAVAEMIAGDVRIPLIFDDPFLSFDRERLEILRKTLAEISQSRQVILLTHREELGEWGTPVHMTGRRGDGETG